MYSEPQSHPAGYSSEYLCGRRFTSRMFGCNNTFTYKAEKKHYGQNESYLTQWHTKHFQNVKLVSLLFKVNEPSKFKMHSFCLNTGERQYSSKQAIIFSHSKHRVATNPENMENLESSGNLKNCQNLREIWTFVEKTWKTQGKWKICDIIANKNALIEFFSLELLQEKN